MGVREAKVERYLDSEVKRLKGLTRKWVSPGHDGVPDRIVIAPASVVTFVEVKTSDGVVSPVQEREQRRLAAQGVRVTTVYGKKGVDEFIDDIFSYKVKDSYGKAQSDT